MNDNGRMLVTGAETPAPLALTTVGDVMAHAVYSVQADDTFKHVADVIAEHHLNAVPVVDAEHHVLGVVTASDLLTRLAGAEPDGPRHRAIPGWQHRRQRRRAVVARDLMTTPAVTVDRTLSIGDAARRALRAGVHLLPVTTDGRLVGVVTRGDLVAWFLRPDAEIRADVVRALDEVTRGSARPEIEVTAEDGVVVLEGDVGTVLDARRYGTAAGAVPGVVGVVNDLRFAVVDVYAPGF